MVVWVFLSWTCYRRMTLNSKLITLGRLVADSNALTILQYFLSPSSCRSESNFLSLRKAIETASFSVSVHSTIMHWERAAETASFSTSVHSTIMRNDIFSDLTLACVRTRAISQCSTPTTQKAFKRRLTGGETGSCLTSLHEWHHPDECFVIIKDRPLTLRSGRRKIASYNTQQHFYANLVFQCLVYEFPN